MKQNYEVKIDLQCRVVVEGAESEERAIEFAHDETHFSQADEIECNVRLIRDQKDFDQSSRHANVVSRDDTA